MPTRAGSGDNDQLAPPSVVEMTAAVPSDSLIPPTATHERTDTHEIPLRRYMPFGSFETLDGREAAVTQLSDASALVDITLHAPPSSVVTATTGSCTLSASCPASQQVVAVTQSIEFGHQVGPPLAQRSGVSSVHV
jgi:hypothetical protein